MAQLHLRFGARAVAQLVSHAAAYQPLVDSAKYRKDPTYWRPGAAPNAQGVAPVEDIDFAKVPRYLILTRERETIYLVAGTAEQLPDPADPVMRFRVYAEEYAPGNANGQLLAAALGDLAFAEDLDLRWFDDASRDDCRFIRLGLSATQVRLLAAERSPGVNQRMAASRSR